MTVAGREARPGYFMENSARHRRTGMCNISVRACRLARGHDLPLPSRIQGKALRTVSL